MFISYKGGNIGYEYNPTTTPVDQAKIQGVSQLLGTPTPLRVMLQDRRDGKVLRHWVTPESGLYDFNVANTYLGYTHLMLIAFDDTNGLSADIVDHIEPVNG